MDAVRAKLDALRLKRRDNAVRGTRIGIGHAAAHSSQAVRQGREIEARSASSCCDRPVRLRAPRSMPPVVSTIVMSGIVGAARIRVNVRIFYQALTSPTGLGLLASPAAGSPRSGSAWLGRSQKDGLPAARGEVHYRRLKTIDSRWGGAAWSLPLSNRERERTPREQAILSSSPSCRCSAQPSPGLWITPFSARSLPRSVPAPYSAPDSQGTGADMDKDFLTLQRASGDDYDVIADGVVVGRIFYAAASPVGSAWMWTLGFGYHEDRTPPPLFSGPDRAPLSHRYADRP